MRVGQPQAQSEILIESYGDRSQTFANGSQGYRLGTVAMAPSQLQRQPALPRSRSVSSLQPAMPAQPNAFGRADPNDKLLLDGRELYAVRVENGRKVYRYREDLFL